MSAVAVSEMALFVEWHELILENHHQQTQQESKSQGKKKKIKNLSIILMLKQKLKK